MLRIRDYSITSKLTWMNMLVSGAALLLASGVLISYERFSYRQTMVRDLSVQAQIIGGNCISALFFNDRRSAENTLELSGPPHTSRRHGSTRPTASHLQDINETERLPPRPYPPCPRTKRKLMGLRTSD